MVSSVASRESFSNSSSSMLSSESVKQPTVRDKNRGETIGVREWLENSKYCVFPLLHNLHWFPVLNWLESVYSYRIHTELSHPGVLASRTWIYWKSGFRFITTIIFLNNTGFQRLNLLKQSTDCTNSYSSAPTGGHKQLLSSTAL